MIPPPIIATALAFIAVCALVDIRTRRIPNLLSGSGMLAGMLLNTLYSGLPGLVVSMSGLAVTVAVLLAPFALGGVGGGDVKMMAALGALIGPWLALAGLALGMVLGGVIMVGHLARTARLREKLGSMRVMISAAAATRSIAPLKVSAADPAAIGLPYSVPLGLGTIAALVLGRLWGVGA